MSILLSATAVCRVNASEISLLSYSKTLMWGVIEVLWLKKPIKGYF
jgi:hypothetical protein